MTANKAQIEYWNGPTGENWAQYNNETDRSLADAAEAALKLAAARPGERVLDIGCGAGAASLSLADQVGPGGHVMGVDVSRPLLAMARSRVQAANVEFLEADAALYPFQPEFDLIFSRFGVMFFVDPIAAFANIRKAAGRNARLAFICWRSVEENEWASLPYSVAKPFLPERPPADSSSPGPFAFADAGRLRAVLETAGFSDIRIEKFSGVMDLGPVPAQAAFQVTSLMGPTTRVLRNADEATRNKVLDTITKALAKLQAGEGPIRLGTACWLVGARA